MANRIHCTHCLQIECEAKRYGTNSTCLRCGSTSVTHFDTFACEVCGREYSNEDSADECCQDEDVDEDEEPSGEPETADEQGRSAV